MDVFNNAFQHGRLSEAVVCDWVSVKVIHSTIMQILHILIMNYIYIYISNLYDLFHFLLDMMIGETFCSYVLLTLIKY